ncbi:MAG: efflux RND transporter periplasmic adaptor subunit [Methylococcaceae bacterium]|nr:efflux RND transporter periplasmic adaptor subunit [Methylococcaceae bacterium]
MKRLFIPLMLPLLAGCDQPLPPPPIPRPALVLTVGTHTAKAPTILVGEVRSRFETAQSFRIDGKIVERRVDIGDSVKKGQLLARLDNIDTGLSSQAANAQTRAAEADLALAEAELERYRQLHARKFISSQALDIQEAQFKSAAAKVKQARAQAEVSGNQTRYTDLLAERDGVVTEIRAEPGQVVETGEVIARIAVPNRMEVAIAVPESRMDGIAVGTAAEVRLWADSASVYHGKVREVAPAADSVTRTFQVRVALPEAGNKVRLGMTAGVGFHQQDNGALLLPTPAVTRRDGQNIVWVVDAQSGQVQPRVVQTGAFREDGVIVTQGLHDGEQVVVAGVQTLVPGQIVRPVSVENRS